MSKQDKHTPSRSPLGPERSVPPLSESGASSPHGVGSSPDADAPAQTSSAKNPNGKRVTRLDAEIERLRQSPTPTQTQQERSSNSFIDGVAFMGIFSRTRDIIAANFNDMLDKADDPSKMIRMIILEMEETLVEVRASAARTIADQKEMHRHTVKLDRLQADWGEKAQLALSKDREDLARAALVERKKAADMADQLKQEIAVLDDALRAYEEDIQKLQHRLREARSRQTQIAARLESAENRVKLRTLMSTERTDEALARFDQLERRVDYAEGRAEALSIADLSGKPSLADEIAALAGSDAIDDELEQMKRALGKGSASDTNTQEG
ncbi:phage shock protein PspA [Altererythrobacter sp. GH1-8]|uniref:phage shock protein PspA n=1 Tax=Altererythrobacter sp. GH1-8 TaxID=3349333 RepID=UPI00374D4B92